MDLSAGVLRAQVCINNHKSVSTWIVVVARTSPTFSSSLACVCSSFSSSSVLCCPERFGPYSPVPSHHVAFLQSRVNQGEPKRNESPLKSLVVNLLMSARGGGP